MMRVEDDLHACAWTGPSGLAAGGAAGVYVFDFLAGSVRKAVARGARLSDSGSELGAEIRCQARSDAVI